MTAKPSGFSLKQLMAIACSVMLLTAVGTALAIRIWLFPEPFQPVVLDEQEKQRLEQKLDRLSAPHDSKSKSPSQSSIATDFNQEGNLNPEPYSEQQAEREITFSEREINGLLANNTDFAQKVAIDLAEDLISLRLLLPLDPDFPVIGGKTLRLRAGAELAYRNNRPVVILKGVSLMGMPLPNAWLGGLKNIDLMREFGGQPGFWQSFGNGVESIQVREGELHLRLKE